MLQGSRVAEQRDRPFWTAQSSIQTLLQASTLPPNHLYTFGISGDTQQDVGSCSLQLQWLESERIPKKRVMVPVVPGSSYTRISSHDAVQRCMAQFISGNNHHFLEIKFTSSFEHSFCIDSKWLNFIVFCCFNNVKEKKPIHLMRAEPI